MRIISGKYKGFVIQAPKNLPVRPTTDRAKEALFNILNNQVDFESISVLDLFSGTGNVSFEFISRGVSQLTLVERDAKCIKFINSYLPKLEADFVKTIHKDVFQFVEETQEKYDLIFLDPPYLETNYILLIQKILEFKLLNENGTLIAEHLKTQKLDHLPYFIETRNYGECAFSFFEFNSI